MNKQQLEQAVAALKAHGIRPDGKTTVAEAIHKLAALQEKGDDS